MIEYFYLGAAMAVLLVAKGFFSGSEIAVVSSDKLKLRTMANRGDRRARLLLNLFRNPESLLATTLIGTNVATMTLTVLGTATVISIVGPGGDLYAVLLLAPISLIFGEIVPKSIFQQQADRIAPRVALPLTILKFVLMPVVAALGWVGKLIAKSVAPETAAQSPFLTRQRVRMMLESTEQLADTPVLDRDRIRRAIRLSQMTVGEAIVPLPQVVGAEHSATTAELLAIGRRAGHRRIPLYDGNLSNIVSVATWTVWDEMSPEISRRPVEELTVEPHFASTLQRLDDLLPILLARADRMAVAVDEFGGAAGIVTLEDLMTILLGNVARGVHLGPEGWQYASGVERSDDGTFLMDARTRLIEIAELLDVVLPSREFHTLGGFLTSRLRRIPQAGDTLEEFGYRFTILDATSRAPTRVKIEPAVA